MDRRNESRDGGRPILQNQTETNIQAIYVKEEKQEEYLKDKTG